MPRVRMSDADIAAARKNILQQAAEIVREVGFDGLSMRVLADHLGVSPGALYRYFPSKTELLWAFWAEGIDQLRTVFATLDATIADPVAAIRAMMHAYADFCLADAHRFQLLFLNPALDCADALQRDASSFLPFELLIKRVAQAADSGILSPGDPQQQAAILWASAHGAITLVMTMTELDFGDPHAFIAQTAEATLRGLSTAGATP